MNTTHYIIWWNLENLFDIENSQLRPLWLAKRLKNELKGWNQEILSKKIANISSVIKKINNGSGPDIMGICEVENENVVKSLLKSIDLTKRSYKILHKDTKDARGIDVAFIYDSNKYSSTGKIFSLEIMKRNATRDIVQIQLKTQNNNELILLGNHWPSRSGGQYKTEPYRIMVAETLSYWIERITEIKGNKAPVIVMGDFNDEPHNRSLHDYALSTHSRYKVSYGRNPYLFNLSWKLMGKRTGTYVYNAEPLLLDQILISKGLVIQDEIFQADRDSIKIETFDGMTSGRYNTPVRFGRPSGKSTFNKEGFSDHLPVSFIVEEKL